MTEPRYALEKVGPSGSVARFCPEVGTILGFPSPAAAMQHIFEVLPNEAHRWHWVPMEQPAATEQNANQERA